MNKVFAIFCAILVVLMLVLVEESSQQTSTVASSLPEGLSMHEDCTCVCKDDDGENRNGGQRRFRHGRRNGNRGGRNNRRTKRNAGDHLAGIAPFDDTENYDMFHRCRCACAKPDQE